MIDEKSAAEAREQLFAFVEELHRFLRRFLNEPYDSEGRLLVLKEMTSELRNAWAEFDKNFNWDRTKTAIYESSTEHLESHGLYGAQLGAKLTLVRTRMDRFMDRITKKGLLKLVDALDTVLDSIIAATGLDGAIKEMKDLLRGSVDDDE